MRIRDSHIREQGATLKRSLLFPVVCTGPSLMESKNGARQSKRYEGTLNTVVASLVFTILATNKQSQIDYISGGSRLHGIIAHCKYRPWQNIVSSTAAREDLIQAVVVAAVLFGTN